MTNIKRPALRYHGGKWKLAPWIISQFPPHVCYVEPFGGGGSVLLRKQPSKIEVYNDINSMVVNFFKVLRSQPDALIYAINYTPYSRQEFIDSQTMEGCNALEKARRFYIWSWQGRGRAGVKEPGGWRFMSRDTRGRTPVDDWNNNSHLWNIANRLLQVQIEHDDALKVIQRFDDPKTLFYIDPPYVQHTRGLRWNHSAYSFEYTDDNHRELAQLLKSITGMIVISGYPSELYNSLYQDWHKIERPGQKDNAPQRDTTECLWLSPNIHTIQKEMKLRQTTILTPGQFSRLWGIPE